MGIQKFELKSARILFWIAQILGAVLAIIIIWIFGIGSLIDTEESIEGDWTEIIPSLIILGFWIIFYIIGWFKVLVGAIGTMVCAVLWTIPIYITSGSHRIMAATLIPSPFLLVGIILLISYFLERRFHHRK